MNDKAVRLSPTGPVIKNIAGGPFEPGIGARLRLQESQITMGGTVAIPTTAAQISKDGFGALTNLLSLSLPNPKPTLNYRAEIRLDLLNPTTTTAGTVELLLDTTVDGVNWTNRVVNGHLVKPQLNSGAAVDGTAREASVALVLTNGEELGIIDGTPAIAVRCRVGASQGGGVVQVNSDASLGSGGTIHLSFEECF